ncbi:hypothetical protein ACCT30_26695, partial [Rhizobium ruizarguesonis]
DLLSLRRVLRPDDRPAGLGAGLACGRLVLMELVKLTEKQLKSRRNRNVALGLVLAGLVVLFYVMAIVKIGGGAAG